MMFAYKDDAERVLAVLAKRLGKYGLQLHPEKTRLVDFRYRPSARGEGIQDGLATSFNFLGFTHIWVVGRKGKPVVRQQTAKDRLARTIKAFNEACRRIRHEKLLDQHARLSRKLKGHFAYFGVSGNYRCLAALSDKVEQCWRKWLSRRSTKSKVTWSTFRRLPDAFPLPKPQIVHRYGTT